MRRGVVGRAAGVWDGSADAGGKATCPAGAVTRGPPAGRAGSAGEPGLGKALRSAGAAVSNGGSVVEPFAGASGSSSRTARAAGGPNGSAGAGGKGGKATCAAPGSAGEPGSGEALGCAGAIASQSRPAAEPFIGAGAGFTIGDRSTLPIPSGRSVAARSGGAVRTGSCGGACRAVLGLGGSTGSREGGRDAKTGVRIAGRGARLAAGSASFGGAASSFREGWASACSPNPTRLPSTAGNRGGCESAGLAPLFSRFSATASKNAEGSQPERRKARGAKAITQGPIADRGPKPDVRVFNGLVPRGAPGNCLRARSRQETVARPNFSLSRLSARTGAF